MGEPELEPEPVWCQGPTIPGSRQILPARKSSRYRSDLRETLVAFEVMEQDGDIYAQSDR